MGAGGLYHIGASSGRVAVHKCFAAIGRIMFLGVFPSVHCYPSALGVLVSVVCDFQDVGLSD